MEAARTFSLGVDIGGTKVAAGLVDADGKIFFHARVPMPARGSAAEGFAAVQSAIEAVFAAHPQARSSLTGIGICAPGPLDPISGVILNPPNVPCWRNFPLAAEVQRVLDSPRKWIMTETLPRWPKPSGEPESVTETSLRDAGHGHRNWDRFRSQDLSRANGKRRRGRPRNHRLQRPEVRLRARLHRGVVLRPGDCSTRERTSC